jgi:hypothetical protein
LLFFFNLVCFSFYFLSFASSFFFLNLFSFYLWFSLLTFALCARTAEALGVPFVALRAVSDLCGPAAGQQFHLELDVVAETSARAVERLAAELAG